MEIRSNSGGFPRFRAVSSSFRALFQAGVLPLAVALGHAALRLPGGDEAIRRGAEALLRQRPAAPQSFKNLRALSTHSTL